MSVQIKTAPTPIVHVDVGDEIVGRIDKVKDVAGRIDALSNDLQVNHRSTTSYSQRRRCRTGRLCHKEREVSGYRCKNRRAVCITMNTPVTYRQSDRTCDLVCSSRNINAWHRLC